MAFNDPRPKQPKPLHAEVARRRKGVRKKGIFWEYNRDGMWSRERIKGFFKAHWKRWGRRNGNDPGNGDWE